MGQLAEASAGSPHESTSGRPLGAGRDRPTRGFELWAWLFMRVSGLVLVVLAVGHVLLMHVVDEGVDRVDFAFVQLRWSSLFWRAWDWLMLILALAHGVIGLRNIVLDYVRRPRLRVAITEMFFILGLALLILGTIVVISFDPAAWPSTT